MYFSVNNLILLKFFFCLINKRFDFSSNVLVLLFFLIVELTASSISHIILLTSRAVVLTNRKLTHNCKQISMFNTYPHNLFPR